MLTAAGTPGLVRNVDLTAELQRLAEGTQS